MSFFFLCFFDLISLKTTYGSGKRMVIVDFPRPLPMDSFQGHFLDDQVPLSKNSIQLIFVTFLFKHLPFTISFLLSFVSLSLFCLLVSLSFHWSLVFTEILTLVSPDRSIYYLFIICKTTACHIVRLHLRLNGKNKSNYFIMVISMVTLILYKWNFNYSSTRMKLRDFNLTSLS